MRTSTGTSPLDEALDRVSALEFELPSRFVNHGPMACEALAALGHEEELDGWSRHFASMLAEGAQPVVPTWDRNFAWEDAVGDHRRLPEWMGYFEREIGEEGWAPVVEVWVPRLAPGLVAALFHGVIRTAHAVRAIDGADTPARRAELARALGNWASWYHRGQPVGDVAAVEDAHVGVVAAAIDGARCYAVAPTIFNLHGVTGAMAVDLLVDHIAPGDGAAVLAHLRADHGALYAGIDRPPDRGRAAPWEDDAVAAAVASRDAHQVKLVEACRRGFERSGSAAFVAAARTVTGLG